MMSIRKKDEKENIFIINMCIYYMMMMKEKRKLIRKFHRKLLSRVFLVLYIYMTKKK